MSVSITVYFVDGKGCPDMLEEVFFDTFDIVTCLVKFKQQLKPYVFAGAYKINITTTKISN